MLDRIPDIDRICFNKWDRFWFRFYKFFGMKKNRLTWREILLRVENEDFPKAN